MIIEFSRMLRSILSSKLLHQSTGRGVTENLVEHGRIIGFGSTAQHSATTTGWIQIRTAENQGLVS